MSEQPSQLVDVMSLTDAQYKRAVAAIIADDMARQFRQNDEAELAKITAKMKPLP